MRISKLNGGALVRRLFSGEIGAFVAALDASGAPSFQTTQSHRGWWRNWSGSL
jgi:hypothetical protein